MIPDPEPEKPCDRCKTLWPEGALEIRDDADTNGICPDCLEAEESAA
jgi:hypothetical protein